MLRRRLFAYAVMFILGIVSGYLLFECSKYLESIMMMVGVALVVRQIDLEYRPDKTELERKLIIAWIIVGFVVFTGSYITMNGRIEDDTGNRISPEEVTSIFGQVTDISKCVYKNGSEERDYYRVLIRPESIHCHGKIQLNYYSEIEDDYIECLGKMVMIYGELRRPSGVENPGCFNYRSYLYSRGIRFTYSCKYMKLVNEEVGWYWLYRRKMMQLRNSYIEQFDDEIEAFIKGIVFGDKSEIDEETQDEFNANSTGHILAVSGLHVGFLFLLLRIITRRKKSKLINAFIIAVIVLYGEMTGWSPSTARAVLVLSISILALYARRTPDLVTSVSAAAIVILTIRPYNIVNSGFQMSFIALLGLCFLSPVIECYIGEYLSVPVAIQLSVAPLIAYSFCSFNIISMFINIPIVLVASLLVPICILGLMVMICAGYTPTLLIAIIEGLTQIITTINSKLTLDKIYVTDIKGLSPGLLLAYYLILFFITSEWTRIKLIRREYFTIRKTVIFLLIPILCIAIATHNPFLDDEIVFVNIGQGDCTHIRCEDINVLIDGGGNQYTNVGKNTLRPYLLHNNVGNIDLALLTHMHMDHFKGIQELSQIYPIKELEQGYITRNYRISNDVWIESIWPDRHILIENNGNENELNTVYIIHYDQTKIMVTGDLTQEDEQKIINRYRGTNTLDCDILKVGHHGSKTSTSDEFLDAITPGIAVISVGAHNTYGHPHQEVLDRLIEHGIEVYRTDINGAVGVDITGTVLTGILCTKGQSFKIDTMK